MAVQAGLFHHPFIIIAIICLCKASTTSGSKPFKRFSVNQGRLSSPYRTMENVLRLQCSAVCAEEDECLAFNHHTVVGSCELVNSSGVQQERQATEGKGWKVFQKKRNTVKTSWLNNSNYLNAGSWLLDEYCSNGSYATAYTMQIQPYDQGKGSPPYPDNTALTAVKLTCADQHGNVTGTITSGVSNCEPGDWGATTPCSTPGHYLTSFKVQNDGDGVTVSGKVFRDQTAVNYVTFRCRDLEGTLAEYEIIAPPGNGHTGTWGNWTDSCPPNQAVCGIKTRTEDDKPDCYGIVDMKLQCCGFAYN